MAYLREIFKKLCQVCKKPAKVTLIDRWNGERGDFCRTCGRRARERQLKNESANDGKVY